VAGRPPCGGYHPNRLTELAEPTQIAGDLRLSAARDGGSNLEVFMQNGVSMSRRHGTRLAAAAATQLVAVLVATAGALPAYAGHLTVPDAHGDLMKIAEGSDTPRPTPAAKLGDIAASRFGYDQGRVTARVKFVELKPVGHRFRLWVDIQTRARRTWTVGVEATPGDRDGHVIFMDGHGRRPACAIRHRLSYSRNLVRVSVPAGCVHTPKALRFTLLTEQTRRDRRYAWIDDGLVTADVGDTHWTRWLERG